MIPGDDRGPSGQKVAEIQGGAAGWSKVCPQGKWGQKAGPSPATNFCSRLRVLGPGMVTFRLVNTQSHIATSRSFLEEKQANEGPNTHWQNSGHVAWGQ